MTKSEFEVGDKIRVVSEYTDTTMYSVLNGKTGILIEVGDVQVPGGRYPYYVKFEDGEYESVFLVEHITSRDEMISKKDLLDYLTLGGTNSPYIRIDAVLDHFALKPKFKTVTVSFRVEVSAYADVYTDDVADLASLALEQMAKINYDVEEN